MTDFDAKSMQAFAGSKRKGASNSDTTTTASAPPLKTSKELTKESSKNKEVTVGGQVLTRKRIQFAIMETSNKRSKTNGFNSGKDKRVADGENNDLVIPL